MRKRWPILSAVLALGIAAAWLLHQEPMYKKKQAGQEIIGKIENLQQIQGRLPDSLSEIGI
ncbi:MAG: hypothetical protein JXQ27_19140 [Acidobacteria bacterium]|nr:hypothetical protein [Acidobacteriota bacterium]